MKLKITLFSLFFFCITQNPSIAQMAQCDTMVIDYIDSQINFTTATQSFGDSVITIPFVNNTHTDFAYPIARIIAISPLPPGMSYTANTQSVFASSWNVGNTATASFFFYVTQAIPLDYTVTFKIRVSNFSPLTYDSCEYINTRAINLNPSSTSIKKLNNTSFSIESNPCSEKVSININEKYFGKELMIYSAVGQLVFKININNTIININTTGFNSGMYYLKIADEVSKLMIQ